MTPPRDETRRIEEVALRDITRRHFFDRCGVGLGSIALATLLAQERGRAAAPRRKEGASPASARGSQPLAPRPAHHRPRARSVIYLFMAGGPSQLELFEDKPKLRELDGAEPPASLLEGKRFAFLKKGATLMGGQRSFSRHGRSGVILSELLPFHGTIVDDVTFIRSMRTDVFNHGPAKLFTNTGFPQPGRPSLGSWVTYGIGSQASDLPGFVVLQSGSRGPRAGASLWASGFLPTTYQGVPFRGTGDPILDLTSPKGFDRRRQRDFFDAVRDLNRARLGVVGDPEIETRIAAYEMAYRMQASAPELMEISKESPRTLELYGAEPGKSSFANNCILARRLVERGVRFVQLYHTNWDHHGGSESLEKDLPLRCAQVDRASAALVLDLKERGLLDETLVVWGGEFGRTPMGEPREPTGRDHHIDAYTIWLAGAGIRPGIVHGETDDLGFGIVDGRVHVHDLQATILHLLGIDHERLTFRFQARDFRLTDVHGEVVGGILT